jgi:pimeloyl-ACP methyl ester carboxylesterase
MTQELCWIWRGFSVSYRCVEGSSNGSPHRRAVVCIHGFGASQRHWRHNLRALSSSASVYAIDLLGFGNSSKPISCLDGEPLIPGGVRYGFDLWAEQIRDFCLEVIAAEGDVELQLIGNSIGGVVALNATRLLQASGHPPRQVILIDCAQRELDLKRLDTQPWSARLGRPLLMALVRQRWLINSLFQLLARPAFVRGVLRQAYPSGRNVDDELVELLVGPSQQPGATESFRGFVNLFNDWLAPQLLAQLQVPVRLLWGAADPWEPVAEARRWQQNHACIQELEVLEGLGHCPHDEAPEQVNPILLNWLQQAWS